MKIKTVCSMESPVAEGLVAHWSRRAFSKLNPPLSGEQIEKIKNAAPGLGEGREQPRRRPETRRDENGLPLRKDTPPEATQPKPAKP